MIAAGGVAAVVLGAALSAAAPPPVSRRPGPSGSLLIVESNHSVPLVHVVVASRSGSASDPRHREGLTNLAAEWARRGAGGRSREAMDSALDALGATLEIRTEQDHTAFEGMVLARNLDEYLALLGDVIVRPNFTANEFARTAPGRRCGSRRSAPRPRGACARIRWR